MPHATMSPAAPQAFVLCGPGDSLSPFNSNPSDYPKALLPIANRPMVWYPMEWCYRMGVTSVNLIVAPACLTAVQSALAQNPYLTSLPSPKATIIAPTDLTLTTATAEVFRLPEVQAAITGDFLVLPCDLVCEMNGLRLWEMYLSLDASCAGPQGFIDPSLGSQSPGLAVWYDTRTANADGVYSKKEETDVLATTALPESVVRPPDVSLRRKIRSIILAMPTDSLQDKADEDASLTLRKQLFQTHSRFQVLAATHRDAHIYFFPYWTKHYLRLNDEFESFGEDVLGFWAKSRWQGSKLVDKLRIQEALRSRERRRSSVLRETQEDDIDVRALSSTAVQNLENLETELEKDPPMTPAFASRVPEAPLTPTPTHARQPYENVPPLLAYVHGPHDPDIPQLQPSKPNEPATPVKKSTVSLIRRVDTVTLVLATSLYIAKLAPPSENPATPAIAHAVKVQPTSAIPQQCTIPTATTLIDANVTLNARITVRESVIGANCTIKSGARITRCVLMEGVVVEERAMLEGCVIGRYAKIGNGSDLKDCSVQSGFAVAEGTKSKGETLAGFEGVEDDDEDEDMNEENEGEGLDFGG